MQRLLTAKDLGQLLGLAVQTIYNRRSIGADLPPALTYGRLLRFDAADVRAWLNAKRATASLPQHHERDEGAL